MKKIITISFILSSFYFIQKTHSQESTATREECLEFIKENTIYFNLMKHESSEYYQTKIEENKLITITPTSSFETNLNKISNVGNIEFGYDIGHWNDDKFEFNYVTIYTFGDSVLQTDFDSNQQFFFSTTNLYFPKKNLSEVYRLIKAFKRLTYWNRQERKKSKF
ncbi:hypothetical protein ACFFU1_00960 [Algibacter miyuki]|uniref:Uncharacterized protein n=1 Tax=Algibacter miyuki TaxID=1306933 RepID=A0ABV5GUZ0_9FLAO|nr:hypothetical protein [Algibacter miyuki]MDN3664779.1 hypothetical protein [Algibacter miyuki]